MNKINIGIILIVLVFPLCRIMGMEKDKSVVLNSKSEYIPIFGDIQYLTNTQYSIIYRNSLEWILNQYHCGAHINCVLHTGDITNNNENYQWKSFQLETEPLAEIIPYFSMIGDHDYTWDEGLIYDRQSTLFNDYVQFPLSTRKVVEWFEEGRMENIVVENTVHGQRLDLLILEFGPREEVVAWADAYVKSHLDHRFILMTHEYLEQGGGRRSKDLKMKLRLQNTTYTTPNEIWNKLVKCNDNICVVLCGHVGGLYAVTVEENDFGHEVSQIQHNIQGSDYRYDNWLMLWEFPIESEYAKVSIFNTKTLEFYNNEEVLFTFKYRKISESPVPFEDVISVVELIDIIGTVEYTVDCKSRIDAARVAYDALTDAQKSLVTNYSVLTNAESEYSALKAVADQAAADQAAADAVISKIAAIGTVEYTVDCKYRIDVARAAYDALTNAQKSLVTNYSVLTDAESEYSALKAVADQAAADAVISKIAAIGTVEYTVDCKSRIDAARVAYDALTDAQKSLVTNYSVLTNAESEYSALKAVADQAAADQAAADAVISKIAAIGTVEYTVDCKSRIDAARAAYDALTDAQKSLVTNYSVLTNAESEYSALKAVADQAAADQAAADAVISKIAAIGTVEYTVDCKSRIDAARAAYDALTDAQKSLVTNYSVLTDAESEYNRLVEIATGIITIEFEKTYTWYDLYGNRLQKQPSRKGIYMVNKKKVSFR